MDNHGSLVSLGDTNLQNVDDKYDKVSLVVEKTPATGWFPHVSPTEIDCLEIFAILRKNPQPPINQNVFLLQERPPNWWMLGSLIF
jgi:hypothetical protein